MFHYVKIAVAVLSIITVMASCTEKPGASRNLGNKPDPLASHIDTTVKPGDDFFNYASGYWFKRNPIPPSESGWGIFSIVDSLNRDRILKISQDASATSGTKGSSSQLIGDFFSSGMDSAGAEALGVNAIKPQLDQIAGITNKQQLATVLAQLTQAGIGSMYSFGVSQDLKNSNQNVIYLWQGGLGLEEASYYFANDAETKAIREAYQPYLATLFRLSGVDSATARSNAATVFNLETKLAKVHRSPEKLRIAEENYTKMSFADLKKLAPDMDWDAHFSAMGIKQDTLVVGQPEYFKTLSNLIKTTPISDWQTYLKAHTLMGMAAYLSNGFVQADFEFNGKLQGGAKQIKPRWQRVLQSQESILGDALGQLYVKEYFSENTRKRYVKLTEAIVESYAEHIKKLDWMSDSTKEKALIKLKGITKKVGYPDKWRDYKGMDITRTNYAQNMINGARWAFNYELAKLGKPVDRSEWSMTPQTYNAYYNPSNNEIVLPAAMFMAPGYSDEELDDALVYGYVGASTIGHELTHGFDDQGRKFDVQGNMVDWWSKQDAEQFTKRTKQIVEQFNNYTILDGKRVNGELTQGENIADLGGIVVGWDAFKKTEQYKRGNKLGGLTPAQRYFLGYAYGWMQLTTPEKMAQRLITDEHAPIQWRVNGPMSMCDAWYHAFNVQPGDKLYVDSTKRVRIW